MGRLLDRRRRKKAASKAMQQAAETNLQSNVDVAQQLASRDYGTSALTDLAADPMDVAVQMDARNRMGEISREGFTDTDRQALNQAFMQSRQEEQAQRGAVMDAAARRGDASGGNALMSSLAAQQGGANRASQFGTDVAMEGRQRALQALGAYGQMGSDMRAQGVGEQVARGSAVDQFNQFATGQRSADTGMLMGARSDQAGYQVQRAEQLKPQTVGQIVGNVMDFAQQAGGLGTQIASAVKSGSDKSSGTSGGAAARTQAVSQPIQDDIDPATGLPKRRTGGFGGAY